MACQSHNRQRGWAWKWVEVVGGDEDLLLVLKNGLLFNNKKRWLKVWIWFFSLFKLVCWWQLMTVVIKPTNFTTTVNKFEPQVKPFNFRLKVLSPQAPDAASCRKNQLELEFEDDAAVVFLVCWHPTSSLLIIFLKHVSSLSNNITLTLSLSLSFSNAPTLTYLTLSDSLFPFQRLPPFSSNALPTATALRERLIIRKQSLCPSLLLATSGSHRLCPKWEEEKECMTRAPYAMMCTTPNFKFAFGLVNRFMLNPWKLQQKAVK